MPQVSLGGKKRKKIQVNSQCLTSTRLSSWYPNTETRVAAWLSHWMDSGVVWTPTRVLPYSIDRSFGFCYAAAAIAMHRRVITLAFHYILKSLYHLPVRMKREREEKHADGYKTHHGGAFRIDRQGVRCHHNATIIALFFFFLLQSFCPVAFFFSPGRAAGHHHQHIHTHVLYIRVFLCAQPHGVQHTEFLITRSQPIKVNMFSKALWGCVVALLGT
jgi:hypothetical protein